jgi:hypothetical protein
LLRIILENEGKSTDWIEMPVLTNAILQDVTPRTFWSIKSAVNLTSITISDYLPVKFVLGLNQYCPETEQIY